MMLATMFSDSHQLYRACQALLAPVGLDTLWTPAGPRSRARELLRPRGELAARERALLGFVFAIWEGQGASVAELLEALAPEDFERVGYLLVAVRWGADALEHWLDDYAPPSPTTTLH